MRRPFASLYVHVPFCAQKCDYCAFYSVPDPGPELRRAYLGRLERELAEQAGQCAALQSIYVGGGTPSFLTVDELAALLRVVHRYVDPAPGAEVTVECNPDSLTPAKVAVLAEHGASRVSLGVQSFAPRLRAAIGRRTGLDGLPEALDALAAHGIVNVGMDLIYAIPGQTLDDWRADLQRACTHGVNHLSTYELTAEEGARLAQANVTVAGEELAVAMWRAAGDVAREFRLRRYEVSNLARPGSECRHNDGVWHGGTYLGVGPAASSFDGEVRRTNPADLDAWLSGGPPEEDRLPPEARAAEMLGLGLRTVRGWQRDEFLDRTGCDYGALRGEELADLAEQGLIVCDEAGVRPTGRGLLFADHVARQLL